MEKEKEVLNKIKDKVKICKKRGMITYTDFLNPFQFDLCSSFIKANEVNFFGFGGYEQAERKIIVLLPSDMNQEDVEIPIKVIHIKSNSKTTKLEHRDVLGAVLGLGLSREKIGDVILQKNSVDVIVYKEVAELILMYLEKLGKDMVSCEEIDFTQLSIINQQFKTIHATVASLRADVIMSCGFNESRSSACGYINKGSLKINHKEVVNPSFMLKEGDLISVRGKGRMLLEKIEGTTKKGRLKIVIKKVI